MIEKKTKLTEEEIKALVRPICICKGIRQSRICDAIQKGCDTVEKVNKMTGSGSGGCHATRCKPVIEALIQNKGKPLIKPHEEPSEE
ncbi:MAG: (2Fe-2S)-binding protein [Silvanigrellaceae bacterium]|nr:(2Fe-2S)-binding protein [Silvanigrellaceae bacterium]